MQLYGASYIIQVTIRFTGISHQHFLSYSPNLHWFFDIKRGVQILISVHLCWYLSYFGSKNILYLEYIQIYLCVKLSIWIKALSSKVRVGCSTHKQQLASRLQQVQILLLAYLCGLDPYELHRSLSLGR